MTGLSAARFYHAAIGAVLIVTIGIACLGVKQASAQGDAPDYAALMAAPDRVTAIVKPINAAIRSHSLPSWGCGRA